MWTANTWDKNVLFILFVSSSIVSIPLGFNRLSKIWQKQQNIFQVQKPFQVISRKNRNSLSSFVGTISSKRSPRRRRSKKCDFFIGGSKIINDENGNFGTLKLKILFLLPHSCLTMKKSMLSGEKKTTKNGGSKKNGKTE